jgi:hypothetical protein
MPPPAMIWSSAACTVNTDDNMSANASSGDLLMTLPTIATWLNAPH